MRQRHLLPVQPGFAYIHRHCALHRALARIAADQEPALGVELDPRSNIRANTIDYRTSLPKLFAAGDMRRGQSLVVWAIREGRQCARAIDEYLMGTSLLPR